MSGIEPETHGLLSARAGAEVRDIHPRFDGPCTPLVVPAGAETLVFSRASADVAGAHWCNHRAPHTPRRPQHATRPGNQRELVTAISVVKDVMVGVLLVPHVGAKARDFSMAYARVSRPFRRECLQTITLVGEQGHVAEADAAIDGGDVVPIGSRWTSGAAQLHVVGVRRAASSRFETVEIDPSIGVGGQPVTSARVVILALELRSRNLPLDEKGQRPTFARLVRGAWLRVVPRVWEATQEDLFMAAECVVENLPLFRIAHGVDTVWLRRGRRHRLWRNVDPTRCRSRGSRVRRGTACEREQQKRPNPRTGEGSWSLGSERSEHATG
jgi:hypothetical protein